MQIANKEVEMWKKNIFTRKAKFLSKYLVFYFHPAGYSVAAQARNLVHEKKNLSEKVWLCKFLAFFSDTKTAAFFFLYLFTRSKTTDLYYPCINNLHSAKVDN